MYSIFLRVFSQINDYFNLFSTDYIPTNNSLVEFALAKNWNKLFDLVLLLSKLQLVLFADLLDDYSRKHMEYGIASQKYALKLCGSGGGGFLLGFTKDKAWVESFFPHALFNTSY